MIDLTDYGFLPAMLTSASLLPDNTEGIPARVTAVHKERYELICEKGWLFGKLKSSIFYGNGFEEFPTVGDFVLINYIPNGDSQILKTLPRTSKFARNDFSGHGMGYVKTVLEQLVAANFDYVFILMSLNHDFNLRRLERYLTLANQSGATPVVILTKADLLEAFAEKLQAVEQAAPIVPVFAVSAKTGGGLNALSAFLKPRKTIVFLGSSGVGKSSLVNALAGDDIMAVKEVRDDDSRGRHTTTHRQLIMLHSGVMIIDTPGMRELGLWDVTTGIGETFSDVERFLGDCRFSNCNHVSEPGCAIKQAIQSGELQRDRWESYLSLKREAKFSDNKAAALREKQEWHKSIAKLSKQNKKNKDAHA